MVALPPAPPIAEAESQGPREPTPVLLELGFVRLHVARQRTARALRRLIRFVGRSLWLIVRWTLTVAVAGAVVGVGAMVAMRAAGHVASNAATNTPPNPITFEPLATRSVVYAKDGSELTVLHAEEDRVPIALDRVPRHVVQAVLDAEDERFFEHGAVDLRSVLRATVNNIEAGSVSQGGSTLTQQLVKTELLTSKKDVNRKLKEAVLAVQMERQYTKAQILERYLNTVYFGNGAYGIQAAAERYFQTDADRLTIPQAVLLAGLIRYPGGSDPFTNPEEAKNRRALVADRMEFLGHISKEEAEQVKNEPLPTPQPQEPPKSSDYFAEKVKQELLQADWLGETYQERYANVFQGGLSIHTTLDPRAQQIAQDTVSSILPQDERGFTAALVSVEPNTGAVRALVGGPGFDQSKFNLVTDGDGRQTGSSFKTFTLAAALEKGILPIDSISGAGPCAIPNPGGAPDPWVPGNVEGQAAGTLTLAQATASSVNCAYARLIKLIGPEAVVDVARRMGITNPIGAHLALTLGSETITPLEMASAYGTIAADGVRHPPYFIDRVEGRDGTVLFRQADRSERAISSQNARVLNSVLTQVVQAGTGTAAALPGRPAAGKTGSTDDNTDAWFVGYTPQLSTAVWMGAPRGRVSMYGVGIFPRVYGGTYPAMMWGAYMRAVLEGEPVQALLGPAPPNRGPNGLGIQEGDPRTRVVIRR
jgi:1A family penicillin-binding protein